MEEQTDKSFIRNVSAVIVVLIVVTFGIVFFARDVGFKDDQGNNPSRDVTTKERIKRVADVYTSEADVVASQPAAAAAAPMPAPTVATVATDTGIDAEKLYNSVCAACHSTGAAGAPKPGSTEMALRAEKGMDVMMQNVLNGLNAMPARGGRPDMSDEQIQAIVDFMLK